MSDHDRRADPALQPFTAEEVQSMREAAEEDRHLARVVATVDALAPQPLTDPLVAHMTRTIDTLEKRLRAAEQRAAAAEGERDALRDQEAWRNERVAEVREHIAYLKGRYGLNSMFPWPSIEAIIGYGDAERQRAETAEARAGRLEAEVAELKRSHQAVSEAGMMFDLRADRLEALLREAGNYVKSAALFGEMMGVVGEQRRAEALFARVDAELLATAAPQPSQLPGAGPTLFADRVECPACHRDQTFSPESHRCYACGYTETLAAPQPGNGGAEGAGSEERTFTFRDARGIIKPEPGSPPPEVLIRRLRGDTEEEAWGAVGEEGAGSGEEGRP